MLFQQPYNFNIKLYFTLIFAIYLLFGVSSNSWAQKKQYVVVLDAGHGGKDPGNIGNGYREKNIVLAVTKIVGRELVKQNDIKVVYTRTNDVIVDLWKRGDIANKAKADLFVSIHCDSHTSQAYGFGTFVLGLHANKQNFEVAKKENAVILMEDNYKEKYKGFDPNSPESVIGLTLMQEENLDKSLTLASMVQKNMKTSLKRKDRGVKQAGFVVLHQTYMPSILVELGFLTNKKEGAYLNSKKGQQQIATQIAKAVKKYINQLKINTVTSTGVVTKPHKSLKKEVKKNVKSSVEFKIQIAASKKKLATKSYNFNGLRNVERVKRGSVYRYFYGKSTNYEEVKRSLKKAKSKGYPSAFVVAFKNGVKIKVSEALK